MNLLNTRSADAVGAQLLAKLSTPALFKPPEDDYILTPAPDATQQQDVGYILRGSRTVYVPKT